MYRRIRLNFFRVHCQFVSGNDRRTSYDYFMLTCGPISAKSQTLAPDGAVSMIADDGGTYCERAAVRKRTAGKSRRGSLIQMTPTISKVIFVALVIGWYLIRYKYARRSRRERIVWSARGPVETALLLISLAGLGLVPLVYVATAIPRFAAYSFHPCSAWLGLFFAIAALGHVSPDASCARPELVDQSRRAGEP